MQNIDSVVHAIMTNQKQWCQRLWLILCGSRRIWYHELRRPYRHYKLYVYYATSSKVTSRYHLLNTHNSNLSPSIFSFLHLQTSSIFHFITQHTDIMAAKNIVVVFGATGKQGGSVVSSILGDPKASAQFAIRGVTRDVTKPAAKALAEKGVEIATVSTGLFCSKSTGGSRYVL
jgi:hypothetical protein